MTFKIDDFSIPFKVDKSRVGDTIIKEENKEGKPPNICICKCC